MSILSNRQTVADNTLLRWLMMGISGQQARLPLLLNIRFVPLPSGGYGLTYDDTSTVPPQMRLTYFSRSDIVSRYGRLVWLAGARVPVFYDNHFYPLFTVVQVSKTEGILDFHYAPFEFGGGVIQ